MDVRDVLITRAWIVGVLLIRQFILANVAFSFPGSLHALGSHLGDNL